MTVLSASQYNTVFPLSLPFGAHRSPSGVSFVLVAPNARQCNVLLFSGDAPEPVRTVPMQHYIGDVFTLVLCGEPDFESYIYEADGQRMTDFYAHCVSGRDAFGVRYRTDIIPHALIESDGFDWSDDAHPQIAWHDMIIYKLHVRGFTKNDPSVAHPGTYLGLTEKIGYLKSIGVNTVLLMPTFEFNEIMQSTDALTSDNWTREHFSRGRKKKQADELPAQKLNYWGYTGDVFYFAPKAAYAYDPRGCADEFKSMVKSLHSAGIEIFVEAHFNSGVPQLQILDCLRYWAVTYHVDGFRIDTDAVSSDIIIKDPYLSQTKFLARRFDFRDSGRNSIYGAPTQSSAEGQAAGATLRQTGTDRPDSDTLYALAHEGFLTDARMFLKGDDGKASAFVSRVSSGVTNTGTINFITDNNGFTLADLYTYEQKHNEKNGDGGRDGTDANFGWNCGAEGPSRRKDVIALRQKMYKNALAVLLLSQGTPMIYAGDEILNSQQGNNNAYCQDNPLGWLDWSGSDDPERTEIRDFVATLVKLRSEHPILHFPTGLRGTDYISCGCPDISFHGRQAWRFDDSVSSHYVGVMFCGKYCKQLFGKADDDFYIAFNMHWEPHVFDLPEISEATKWDFLLSTDTSDTAVKAVRQTPLEQAVTYVAFSGAVTTSAKRKKKSKKPAYIRQFLVAARSIAVFVHGG